jgi:uncharacterized protein (TIGR00245 family)
VSSADVGVTLSPKLTIVSAAAGRMRVQANGFRFDAARTLAIEETVANLTGVRAVRAYPRTGSVVIWYSPEHCDTAAVLTAIADGEHVPAASVPARVRHSTAVGNGGVVEKVIGGMARTLSRSRGDGLDVPPEIERLRKALDSIGYHLEPPTATLPTQNGLRSSWPWARLAWPLGLLVVGSTTVLVFRANPWMRRLIGLGPRAGPSGRGLASGRFRPPVGAMATSALLVPGWGGVVTSLALVAVAAAVAYRQRLGLTRELVVATARAGLQLVGVGAILLLLFQRAGLTGGAGWVIAMMLIAGQVAGRRGAGLPGAKVAATGGVVTGTVVTLGALLAGRVIAAEARVIVPVGGQIVSSAMLAAGVALRRLREEAQQARPEIEARLSLGQSGRQAFLPHQQSALRTALIPTIDSTKVVGLISLPGAMTGLILAGVNPVTAIRYQIVVMYMLLAATALSALTATRLAERELFDEAQRLVQVDQASEPS